MSPEIDTALMQSAYIIEVEETVNNCDAYWDIRGVQVKIANIALLFQ